MTSTAAIEGGRAARVAEAARLRGEGLREREIAERMGVARTTVDAWLHDPDGSRLKARKDAYGGTCKQCGGKTDGSRGPGRASDLCQACRTWEEEDIIAAIRTWAAQHGGIPPKEADWTRAAADHPSSTTVVKKLGWNNALLRAGFGLRMDRRPETQDWIVEQLQAGVPTAQIAAALGVIPAAIHRRMRYWGVRVSDVRAGVRPGTQRALDRHGRIISSASLRRDPRPGPEHPEPPRSRPQATPLPSPSKAR
jgi:transposase